MGQRRAGAWAAWALVGLWACGDAEDSVTWVQFNSGDDTVELEITATGTEPGEAVVADLTSTTGGAVVGQITVDPGSGPVGTLHRVTLQIEDAYDARVQRAELTFDAGDRGEETFSPVQDSADEGLWVLDLRTYGAEGEVRVDTLTVTLYEPEDATDDDTGS